MQENEDVLRYIQGYLEDPETPQEMQWVESTIHYAFDDESWEAEFKNEKE